MKISELKTITRPEFDEIMLIPKKEYWYEIDWDKIKSFEDLKLLIRSIGIGVSNMNINFNEIKHLLKLQNE